MKLFQDKRELKRIHWNIVKRILLSIFHDRGKNKTAISLNCNLSYDKFILYLNWLEMMELINRGHIENGLEVKSLSDRGIKLCIKNFNHIENISENKIELISY